MERERSAEPRDPYKEVIAALLAASALGTATALIGGLWLGDLVVLAAAVALGLASGILIGVFRAQALRRRARTLPPGAAAVPSVGAEAPDSVHLTAAEDQPALKASRLSTLGQASLRAARQLQKTELDLNTLCILAGASAILLLLTQTLQTERPSVRVASVTAGLFLLGAGVATLAARYLAGLGHADSAPYPFPESVSLARGARVLAWVLLLVALSPGLEWEGLSSAVHVVFLLVLAFDAALCVGLFRARKRRSVDGSSVPLNFAVLAIFGRRANIFASALDAAEQQLGIDLRSTWALLLVRRALEPLILCLCVLGWLSTTLTVVGVEDEGLIERFGRPHGAAPLQPGLHAHLPWPVDRVILVPVQRIQTVQVGHESDEKEGPEDVLWAVEHAPNEYTLLLGNGRDLITIDAAVQYRIVNAPAWEYNTQNPAVALKAIAYRAVMRSTVDLTLSDALSQNIATLTGQMRQMVQQEADTLGLGVAIVSFTLGGMHPPVPVAAAYEEVVSAQLGRVTAAVDAQAYRNATVPAAEGAVVTGEDAARAEGLQNLALASGQAWSFRTLESQYRAAPSEFFYRRRLETLEKTLPSRPYTVVDSRFLRAGGEIWMTR